MAMLKDFPKQTQRLDHSSTRMETQCLTQMLLLRCSRINMMEFSASQGRIKSSNTCETQLDNVPFDRNDIIEKIDNLSAGAAAGPDGIPAILLFRKFLKDGNILKMLKQDM